ncbi:universal stress protein [Haloferax mediterranei ATCC 33500]|uniref:Stress response protein n=1 Tax=Haloferax mediterranei (strain ATCC 33500 / DSM 1411 / JCM 8866 / NBRC 14739 / NCIMB 2177 / R-4) TaxID=523841 RepID=I3R7M7_HALMT|nr:universal stress protein [Haloferax mediterranei]AFK20237.2 stress response protein [Haloferax mediterranei ATCC 33500]AHZ23607.1 universal stress protein UspA [Haloferax mediterranei ATCC 33500]ELZ99092.1 stress response protein [Haloferax mediterranei ATCC 33500]MDX5987011.1 universal stress protein [Haloferax mediterranei ATCC 33500]QCQ76328.1 universal stress protein [Haloferax mediterranei ATCC 33500]
MATYVMGTDSVHTSAEVCDYLSQRIETDDVIHVVNSHQGGDHTDSDDVRDGEDAMNVVGSRLGDTVTIETHQYIRGNDPADDILQCAKEQNADEIVIGVRKRNPTSKIVFGSTAQDVLLNSNIPMAVVPLAKVY